MSGRVQCVRSLRGLASSALGSVLRRLRTPHMVYGYRDSSGLWRPRTRVSDTVSMYLPERIRIADNVYIGHFCVLEPKDVGWKIQSWNVKPNP